MILDHIIIGDHKFNSSIRVKCFSHSTKESFSRAKGQLFYN